MAVININRNQFEEMVHSGKTVLVEFSAPLLRIYCRRLAPALKALLRNIRIRWYSLLSTLMMSRNWPEAEAIEVVPTLLIYHNGQALGLSSLRNPERSWWLLWKPYSTGLRK